MLCYKGICQICLNYCMCMYALFISALPVVWLHQPYVFFSSFMRHFKFNYLSHMTWCTQEAKIKKTTACVTFVCVDC